MRFAKKVCEDEGFHRGLSVGAPATCVSPDSSYLCTNQASHSPAGYGLRVYFNSCPLRGAPRVVIDETNRSNLRKLKRYMAKLIHS